MVYIVRDKLPYNCPVVMGVLGVLEIQREDERFQGSLLGPAAV